MKTLILILACSAALPLFSCDECVKILYQKQCEVERYTEDYMNMIDKGDSFISEQYHFLHGIRQGLIDAQIAMKSVVHQNVE